jgi:3-oxoacyl-[acyl-carrier-protein] synthase I
VVRRVVVTGMGIVSCLGNHLDAVARSLFDTRPGIRRVDDYVQRGFRSCVAGIPAMPEAAMALGRRARRYMPDAALYAYGAAHAAIADAGLSAEELRSPRTGLIVGSGIGSTLELAGALQIYADRGPSSVTPYTVPRIMSSTTSANLATLFGVRGTSYSVASACATSAHAIGHGAELIQWGKQDCVIVGGAEEVSWTSSLTFDSMGVLSAGFNDRPEASSRPYDTARDGFVIAGGAGVLVLEEFERARRRGVRIYAELIGYGASSDGSDMVSPAVDGAVRAMQSALENCDDPVDYINAHATSTRVGDLVELEAIRQVFGERVPAISSTKGLSGHSIAAAGVHESIYSLLMLDRGFVAACGNLEWPDPAAVDMPLVRHSETRALTCVLTNSFGFGGTNASLVFRRPA